MAQPLISVVLITYNHENYIAQAIQSTLNQTYSHFELIIIDDGSSDRTGEIVQSFQDPRIRYHYQKNQGPSGALNQGVVMSQGEYIAFFSGDDINEPNRLDTQLYEAQSNQKKVIFSQVSCVGEDGESVSSPSWLIDGFNAPVFDQVMILRRFFEEGNFLNAPTSFIDRQLLIDCSEGLTGPYHPALMQFQDFALWIELAKREEFRIIQQPLVKYRIRSGSENLSAPKPENITRIKNEYSIFIRDFFRGMSDELFKRAFEHRLIHKNFNLPIERSIEEAFLFLGSDVPYTRIHGVYFLSELIRDKRAAKILSEKYQFEPIQISQMLSGESFFSNVHHSSSVYLDLGEGYSEKNRLKSPHKTVLGSFDLTFDLNSYPKIRELRWDPLEGDVCEVELKDAYLIEFDGTKSTILEQPLNHNGKKVADRKWQFFTPDPIFSLPIGRKVQGVRFVGRGRILNPQEVSSQIEHLMADQKKKKLFRRIIKHFFR